MNNRYINNNHVDDKKNSGPLGTLPNEILIKKIGKQLPQIDIQNIRQSCRFFANNTLLKKTMDEKNIRVITGGEHTFWFKNGKVFGSGSNDGNVFGVGENINSCVHLPQIVLPNKNPIEKIIGGYYFAFYFDTKSNCYLTGQFGPNDFIKNSFSTMLLPNGNPIVDVVAGHDNGFLCDNKGNWYGIGDNTHGKLGINSEIRITHTPIEISLPNGLAIAKIIAGYWHTFFQDINNQWFSCGYGGCIGEKELVSIYMPKLFILPDNKSIVEVIAYKHSYFICNNEGQWYAWGDNSYGQLSLVSGKNHTVPQPIQLPNGKPIKKILTSGTHTFMCDIDKQWFGCGHNVFGQLLLPGGAFNYIKLTPITLPNHDLIAEIHLGSFHTLVKDDKGNWRGYGRNQHGVIAPNNMTQTGEIFYIDPIIFKQVNEEKEVSRLLAKK
jgi:alpha-tubulin suppressor-like RCC1 family protein